MKMIINMTGLKGNESGQSILEVVFSIGLIMMVLTGIVTLLINMLGARSKSYDQNRAVELSQIVMEGVVNQKQVDPTSFWDLSSTFWNDLSFAKSYDGFADYTYTVSRNAVHGNGCSLTVTECVDVVVNIFWKNGNTDSRFNRFFSRK